MILKGNLALTDRVVSGSVEVMEGRISAISETGPMKEGELFILPGFVDIHTHGSGGYDFMDGTASDILEAARSHARHGTTTCLPTSLTCSDEELFLFLDNLRCAKRSRPADCARIPGAHLEGPYFDMVQKGAQDARYIRSPKPEHYNRILERGEGLIRRWSVAPELDGAVDFMDAVSRQGILISAGHTAATYDEISRAYDHGMVLLTHFYSAMSSIERRGGFRVMGTVESGYMIDGLNIELICDASHLPPDLLRMIFKLKDHGRIVACSDSMRGAGMPDGPSILGPRRNGTACIIEDGVAKMPDRTCFAGSVATGERLARTLHRILGLDMGEVSRILSLQPASLIGLGGEIGSIEVGKRADLVVCTDDVEIREIYIDGNAVV